MTISEEIEHLQSKIDQVRSDRELKEQTKVQNLQSEIDDLEQQLEESEQANFFEIKKVEQQIETEIDKNRKLKLMINNMYACNKSQKNNGNGKTEYSETE